MRRVVCIVCLAAFLSAGVSPAMAQTVTLFQTRVHGFNQGNRNLDILAFNADGSEAGYIHDLQCSIVYWADGDTTFPFELTYDPAARQVTWVVDTPDSGALTTTSPTAPPAAPVNNLHLFVKATAGADVNTCFAVPYQYCRAGGWDCNPQAQVDSSAVYLTDLELDGVPLADLSASADLGHPTPLEAVDVPVGTTQPWTLTGNVRFTWSSANGYPPKETRILFSATGQYIPPPPCTDGDGDGYSVEGGDCGPVDCNDGAPKIYPGAPEICDGADNQCAGDAGYGQVDEGCASTCAGSAEATIYNRQSPVYGAWDLGRHLGWVLLPIGAGAVLGFLRRRR